MVSTLSPKKDIWNRYGIIRDRRKQREGAAMKSKAKRNHNRPASFREKCRNAFGGALKGLADINAAEKENVAASFDLDKRSVERRSMLWKRTEP